MEKYELEGASFYTNGSVRLFKVAFLAENRLSVVVELHKFYTLQLKSLVRSRIP